MTDKTAERSAKPVGPGRNNPDMGGIDPKELGRLYEESFVGIEEGAIIKGKIVKVTEGEVYVDIGYKSEGVVPISEFSDPTEIKAGDEIDVLLESTEDPDGMVVLSKTKAEKQKRWDETILQSREGNIVEGRIMRIVKGGVIVDIGMDAFLPASQIDIRHVSNVEDYIGKFLEFKIIKINTERKNIVLSRRELLEEERAHNREKLLAEIEVGQIREGVVKNITDFGAFIDLYGMDGLLHITDMTWGRISHPSEVLSVGDKVEVMVLDFDREKQRIALGLKQKTPNPWENIESKYPVGSIVKGKIVNIVPYGAFFEIEEGVEGLIHISEMSWTKRINHPSEILSVGDEVEAMVLNIRKDEAKISLGIKQTEFNPWSVVEEKYPVGSRIRGKVRNITSYGAFVELEEGIDGLIHISDMSWTRKINHPSEVLKKGDVTESLVLAVDQEAKKITLGLKQLQENPWDTIDEFVQAGSIVEAEVTKIADFGVFATIENGIECLVHISQLSDKPFQKIEDVVKKGDKVKARVDRIDRQRRKIALSIRDYQRDLRLAEEKAAMEAVQAMSLGDESIVGMKEHIEEAVERLSSPVEAEPAAEEVQTVEAREEAERPPAAEEELAVSPARTAEPEAPEEVFAEREELGAEERSPEEPGAEAAPPEGAVAEKEVPAEEAAWEEPPAEAIAPEPSAAKESEAERPAPEEPSAEATPPEPAAEPSPERVPEEVAETPVEAERGEVEKAAEPEAEGERRKAEEPSVEGEEMPEIEAGTFELAAPPEFPTEEREFGEDRPTPEEPAAEATRLEPAVPEEEVPAREPGAEMIAPEPARADEELGDQRRAGEEPLAEATASEAAGEEEGGVRKPMPEESATESMTPGPSAEPLPEPTPGAEAAEEAPEAEKPEAAEPAIQEDEASTAGEEKAESAPETEERPKE